MAGDQDPQRSSIADEVDLGEVDDYITTRPFDRLQVFVDLGRGRQVDVTADHHRHLGCCTGPASIQKASRSLNAKPLRFSTDSPMVKEGR